MSYAETAGLRLPDDPAGISCIPYLQNLMWCYGPSGVWTGLYREGSGTSCVPYMDRFVTCAQVKISPSHEKQMALLNEAKVRLAKHEKLPDRAPVFKFRSEPPSNFHRYQTLTDDEWEAEFQNLFSTYKAESKSDVE